MSGVCARVTGRRQRLATSHVVTARAPGRRQRLAASHVVTARSPGRRRPLVTVHVVTARGVQPRHLGRGTEHAPQVFVARHDFDESIDDRHAVPAPPDDVHAGAHRGKRGTPGGCCPRSLCMRRVLGGGPRVCIRPIGANWGVLVACNGGGLAGPGHGLVPRGGANRRPRAARISRRSSRGRRPSWSR